MTNTLVGGDKSHRLENLTHMFQFMAQQTRDANNVVDKDLIDGNSSKKKVSMIRDAIQDEDGILPIQNKGVYSHVAYLCDRWNTVVDICNGKDGAHTPENVLEQQSKLLDILSWFS